MKKDINFRKRFENKMKLRFSAVLLRGSFLLILLQLCGMLAAQDSLPQPKIRELGLRFNTISSQIQTQKSTDGTVHHHYETIGIELYSVRNIAHQNFIRFGLGYNLFHQKSTYFQVAPTGIGRDTSNEKRHHVTYEIGFGHTFKQSSHPFWERLRLRAGMTLAGISTLYEKRVNSNWDQNYGATPQYSHASIVKFYNDHNLHLNAFWQMGFRVTRHCLVGLEWQVGPNLNFHLYAGKQTVPAPSPGTGYVQSRGLMTDISLEWRHIISGPKLWAGICF